MITVRIQNKAKNNYVNLEAEDNQATMMTMFKLKVLEIQFLILMIRNFEIKKLIKTKLKKRHQVLPHYKNLFLKQRKTWAHLIKNL